MPLVTETEGATVTTAGSAMTRSMRSTLLLPPASVRAVLSTSSSAPPPAGSVPPPMLLRSVASPASTMSLATLALLRMSSAAPSASWITPPATPVPLMPSVAPAATLVSDVVVLVPDSTTVPLLMLTTGAVVMADGSAMTRATVSVLVAPPASVRVSASTSVSGPPARASVPLFALLRTVALPARVSALLTVAVLVMSSVAPSASVMAPEPTSLPLWSMRSVAPASTAVVPARVPLALTITVPAVTCSAPVAPLMAPSSVSPVPALDTCVVVASVSASAPLIVPVPALLVMLPPLLVTALAMLAPARSSVAPEAIATAPELLPALAVPEDRRSVPSLMVVPPL